MPSQGYGQDMPLSRQAETLTRELRLTWENRAYLHTIIGSLGWIVKRRYSKDRPQSEMNPAVYVIGLPLTILLSIITLPIGGTIVGSVLLALGWYHIGELLNGDKKLGGFGEAIFHTPLRATLWVMKHILDLKIFRARLLSSPDEAVNYEMPLASSKEEIQKAASESKSKPSPAASQETWLLVNGIVETPTMARNSAKLITDLTGRNVTVFYNPTFGMCMDLAECLLGRTLNTASGPAEAVADMVEDQLLKKNRNVVLICHSQGTIITMNAVRSLCHRTKTRSYGKTLLEALSRLEVYSFAAAADEFVSIQDSTGATVPFAEHFAAEWDFVSRIGALTFSGWLASEQNRHPEAWNGRMHVLRAKETDGKREEDWQGHLVKEHLWPAIVENELGSDSVFLAKYGINRKSAKTKAS